MDICLSVLRRLGFLYLSFQVLDFSFWQLVQAQDAALGRGSGRPRSEFTLAFSDLASC